MGGLLYQTKMWAGVDLIAHQLTLQGQGLQPVEIEFLGGPGDGQGGNNLRSDSKVSKFTLPIDNQAHASHK